MADGITHIPASNTPEGCSHLRGIPVEQMAADFHEQLKIAEDASRKAMALLNLIGLKCQWENLERPKLAIPWNRHVDALGKKLRSDYRQAWIAKKKTSRAGSPAPSGESK